MCDCCAKPENAILERADLNPIEQRKCHDVLWLIAFIGAIILSGYISYRAFNEGDLNVLKYGISDNNTLCGTGVEADNPKLVYCFNATLDNAQSLSYSSLLFKVCAPSCPSSGNDLKALYQAKSSEFVQATHAPASYWEANNYFMVRAACVAPSLSVLNRCLLDASITNSSVVDLLYSNAVDPGNTALISGSQMVSNAYHDIVTTWYVILVCGVAVGLGMSFLWLQLLRVFAPLLVWLTILVFFIGIVVLDALIATKAGYLDSLSQDTPSGNGNGTTTKTSLESEYEYYYKYLFWIFVVFTVIAVLMFFYMVNRIRLAIALIRESADVMIVMPQILFTPLVAAIAFCLVVVYFMFGAAFLASTGTIENGGLTYDTNLRTAIVYHVFMCFWLMFFVHGFHVVVLAGAVATYYWTRDKSSIHFPVLASIYRTLFNHVGSIAFGSLILAIVRTIRMIVLYLSRKLKKRAKDNKIVKFVLCCVNCCLYCVEKFIRYLTKNAYIMIAVDGQSFCVAAGQGWKLLTQNIGRMTTVNVVTWYLFVLSKVGVGIVCAISTSVWVTRYFTYDGAKNEVSSSFAPSVCAFIVGYLIAHIFFQVVDFAIDTLLLCFCLDDIRNYHTGNYFASTRLQRFMAVAPKHDKTEHE